MTKNKVKSDLSYVKTNKFNLFKLFLEEKTKITSNLIIL